jgi:hypothetical protein
MNSNIKMKSKEWISDHMKEIKLFQNKWSLWMNLKGYPEDTDCLGEFKNPSCHNCKKQRDGKCRTRKHKRFVFDWTGNPIPISKTSWYHEEDRIVCLFWVPE